MEFPWRCNVDTIAMDLKVSWEMSVKSPDGLLGAKYWEYSLVIVEKQGFPSHCVEARFGLVGR